jgi:hypothetical protein
MLYDMHTMEPKQDDTKTTQLEKPEDVICDLEQKGYVEVAKALPNILSDDKAVAATAGEQLIGFMTAGAKTFEEKTGRPMTYAEMREAWG